MDYRRIGQELKNCRKRRGLTQAQAAETIGVARTTMIAIEQGVRRIKASEIIKLAEVYAVRVSDIVRERTPQSEPAIEQFYRHGLLRRPKQNAGEWEQLR